MLGKEFHLLSEAACVCIYVFMYLSAYPSGILAGRCKHAPEVSHLRAAPVVPFLISGSLFRFPTESFKHEPDCLLSLLSNGLFQFIFFVYISHPGPRLRRFSCSGEWLVRDHLWMLGMFLAPGLLLFMVLLYELLDFEITLDTEKLQYKIELPYVLHPNFFNIHLK